MDFNGSDEEEDEAIVVAFNQIDMMRKFGTVVTAFCRARQCSSPAAMP